MAEVARVARGLEVVDLAGVDQVELHRDLAVVVGLVGQLDGHVDLRFHRVHAADAGAGVGRVHDHDVDRRAVVAGRSAEGHPAPAADSAGGVLGPHGAGRKRREVDLVQRGRLPDRSVQAIDAQGRQLHAAVDRVPADDQVEAPRRLGADDVAGNAEVLLRAVQARDPDGERRVIEEGDRDQSADGRRAERVEIEIQLGQGRPEGLGRRRKRRAG